MDRNETMSDTTAMVECNPSKSRQRQAGYSIFVPVPLQTMKERLAAFSQMFLSEQNKKRQKKPATQCVYSKQSVSFFIPAGDIIATAADKKETGATSDTSDSEIAEMERALFARPSQRPAKRQRSAPRTQGNVLQRLEQKLESQKLEARRHGRQPTGVLEPPLTQRMRPDEKILDVLERNADVFKQQNIIASLKAKTDRMLAKSRTTAKSSKSTADPGE